MRDRNARYVETADLQKHQSIINQRELHTNEWTNADINQTDPVHIKSARVWIWFWKPPDQSSSLI